MNCKTGKHCCVHEARPLGLPSARSYRIGFPCRFHKRVGCSTWGSGTSAFSRNAVVWRSRVLVVAAADMKALIFDCDGVILESEDLHRVAYNATFQHFHVKPNGKGDVADWSVQFYDDLQNRIGGGKPKMRWYFGKFGWPSSTVLPTIPETEEEKTSLINTLQDWKTNKYQKMIGEVEPRPGVLKLFDEAREAGLKVGVCSAATKSSAICVLENLLGSERFRGLDVFMAGDDVPNKKPDPSIYEIAAKRLQVDPAECLVIEDSTIGLKAAKGAGMRCIITYTSSTDDQDFEGAERILSGLDEANPRISIGDLRTAKNWKDNRSRNASS